MIDQILQAFHLKEHEIEIVRRMLELGPQAASTIARMCDKPRNTVRCMLDTLVQRGLLTKTNRANTQYYGIEKRENLIRALKVEKMKMQYEMDKKIYLLEAYGRELGTRQETLSRTRIRSYEGWSGLEKIHENLLAAQRVKSWTSYDDMIDAMPEYFRTFFPRMKESGVPLRALYPDSPRARAAQKNDAKELRESALASKSSASWGAGIYLYDGKVAIASWREKLGILIESMDIANSFEAMFDALYADVERSGKCTHLPQDVRKKFERASV